MAQKDLTEKNLEYYPDVFADTVNALLYEGKMIIKSQNLQPAPTETIYSGKEKGLRNQFHDVSKYEMLNGKIKVQYTLENESKCNRKMILRKAGYEGAVYREQFDGKVQEAYPVISLLLHWGKSKWRASKSIKDFFEKENLADEVVKYIDNMHLYVYDMRYLPKKVRKRFRSDMRVVVDYLAEGKLYSPTNQKICHVEAFLRMMHALSGDVRYQQMITEVAKQQDKEGGVTMCELLDKYENEGINKGINKGIERVNKLVLAMLHDKRNQDIERAVSDKEYQQRLFIEYGL